MRVKRASEFTDEELDLLVFSESLNMEMQVASKEKEEQLLSVRRLAAGICSVMLSNDDDRCYFNIPKIDTNSDVYTVNIILPGMIVLTNEVKNFLSDLFLISDIATIVNTNSLDETELLESDGNISQKTRLSFSVTKIWKNFTKQILN